MHIVISRFEVANGLEAEVKKAFRERPHMVDGAPGFIRIDVVSPLDNPAEIQLITFWEDEASYETWYHSHAYSDSHAGIPKGLKLNPKKTKIRAYEHVVS
ncbi:antibiotic biosynthesis monooxygenase [Magnetospira sp. QH-2]|uniref:antibiotic biosynthesis monooxygenase family protein n=1 Tax=Magnetospira sp. (strain QH-2) TaxID=1288970 RepID=UPI0003E81B6F|nr:antibiotic biosynthesis monooxygenase family protein [Magnetospira sp. QH-2]CCQ74735.1 putative antibiotic biosynthesis monooxygenase [Magnetospira sp. QH-2]